MNSRLKGPEGLGRGYEVEERTNKNESSMLTSLLICKNNVKVCETPERGKSGVHANANGEGVISTNYFSQIGTRYWLFMNVIYGWNFFHFDLLFPLVALQCPMAEGYLFDNPWLPI